MRDCFLITCEHGGNHIPALYQDFFRGHAALLDSHRGYDAGALAMARALAAGLRAPLVSSTTSRLLVDLNRSIGHPQLFSAAIRAAPATLRSQILQRHYQPYRDEVEGRVAKAVARGRRVIHVSSHSFTPVLSGVTRCADAGLLYDPARHGEAALCGRWKAALAASAPWLRVRRNYPYAGKGDGMTRHLRQRFAPDAYIGVELELNQAMAENNPRRLRTLRGILIESLRSACAV